MTQNAVVTKILPDDMAEVAVTRTTACGGNCGNCESCIFQNELRTVAKNRLGAVPGQHVVIESVSSKVYKAVFLVYLLPVILLLVGFSAAYLLGAGEGVCVLSSFAGLIVGAAVIVLSQRRKNKDQITFEIISNA